jgi:hypothetical protein
MRLQAALDAQMAELQIDGFHVPGKIPANIVDADV